MTIDAEEDFPEADHVRTRDDFVSFVQEMTASLDRALAEPMPERPYLEQRRGWVNWANLWSFWEAMIAWLDATGNLADLRSEPIAGVLLEPVEEPSEAGWNDVEGLREFLRSVESWATHAPDVGSPHMWERAAHAMASGVTYE